jgi:hypothetical protein
MKKTTGNNELYNKAGVNPMLVPGLMRYIFYALFQFFLRQ